MITLSGIQFLDIETVPSLRRWDELSERQKAIFEKKFEKHYHEHEPIDWEAVYQKEVSFLAEFSKVCCCSLGVWDAKEQKLRVKAFVSRQEKEILSGISKALNGRLCGHNLKSFDAPFLCRRFVVNKMPLPEVLNIAGKKPWEISHIDTMELWQFGNLRHTASLESLAALFELPSPKAKLSGDRVKELYYSGDSKNLPFDPDDNLKQIADYCNFDVVTTANVYLRINGQEPLAEQQIVYVS